MATVKLTWHEGNEVWSKVVGKQLSKNGKRLVQAQWYFTPNLEESQSLAAARRAEWRKMKAAWSGHQVYLEMAGDPFAAVPHWYARRVEQKEPSPLPAAVAAVTDELRRASTPTQSDVAQMYEDMDIGQCSALFLAHRKQREGIDFKPTTNKSFKIDLSGALRAIDNRIRMVDLMPCHLEEQRLNLVRTCSSVNTAKNYGRAMEMMLDWYYDSPYFFGGLKPKGIADAFARYPKRRPAKPEHLTPAVLNKVLAAASHRRRLYLLLMLNTGMQPTDIPHVKRDSIDLDGAVVKWHRQKNERLKNPADHEITSHLWPETVALVAQFVSKKPGPAFRTVDGQPLYHESASSNRHNAVTKNLAKLFDKLSRNHQIEVSAKNFRQTGAQLIQDVTEDYDLSKIWLGRKFKMVDRPYLRQVYRRLNEASGKVRDTLALPHKKWARLEGEVRSRQRSG